MNGNPSGTPPRGPSNPRTLGRGDRYRPVYTRSAGSYPPRNSCWELRYDRFDERDCSYQDSENRPRPRVEININNVNGSQRSNLQAALVNEVDNRGAFGTANARQMRGNQLSVHIPADSNTTVAQLHLNSHITSQGSHRLGGRTDISPPRFVEDPRNAIPVKREHKVPGACFFGAVGYEDEIRTDIGSNISTVTGKRRPFVFLGFIDTDKKLGLIVNVTSRSGRGPEGTKNNDNAEDFVEIRTMQNKTPKILAATPLRVNANWRDITAKSMVHWKAPRTRQFQENDRYVGYIIPKDCDALLEVAWGMFRDSVPSSVPNKPLQDPDVIQFMNKLDPKVVERLVSGTSYAQELIIKNRDMDDRVNGLRIENKELREKIQELQSKEQVLQSKEQDLESKDLESESTVQELRSTHQILQSNDKDLESNDQDLQSNDQDLQSNIQELQSKGPLQTPAINTSANNWTESLESQSTPVPTNEQKQETDASEKSDASPESLQSSQAPATDQAVADEPATETTSSSAPAGTKRPHDENTDDEDDTEAGASDAHDDKRQRTEE
ncbi:hypothetical protein K491DRAFT_685819 [Lophiostoma macrostomum CBS 122681]|uniref:Uncharacterized protein n=1 Tax=Lophiostoma macrostomum CBS 122681 TaxID=1314788 RepID=A0A6A6SI56_9PLEO|nr:hypothetical protein K491DRAFT_685819 [Lophiostoma macrostomum CBS 122681]